MNFEELGIYFLSQDSEAVIELSWRAFYKEKCPEIVMTITHKRGVSGNMPPDHEMPQQAVRCSFGDVKSVISLVLGERLLAASKLPAALTDKISV